MGKVYASSDWHGTAGPALKLLEYLKPDDKLYFLGDAIDRGNNGILLFNTLLSDPRVIYLMGNHEDMMAKAIPLIINDVGYEVISEWIDVNGGAPTWEPISYISNDTLMDYVDKIYKLHYNAEYISPKGHIVLLEHAGYTPFARPHRSHNPLWDREHFYDRWNEEWGTEGLEPDKVYMVHGHTPVQAMKYYFGYINQPPLTKEEMLIKNKWWESEEKPEVIRYCNDHKFNIDMCTAESGRIALLDLDTFETIYFDAEDNNE